MSIFRQAFMEYILDKVTVTAIVGTDGVYGYLAPQDAELPFVVISLIGGGTYKNLTGPNGRQEEFWQVSPFAKTDLECENLKNVLLTLLDTCTATTMSPDNGTSSYTVDNIYLDDGGIGGDIEETDRDGSEDKVVQKPLTFRILRSTTTTLGA